ncbi:MAG: DUF1674 domain-containing protein [Alphaproteobacteria bacterium]|nr:DUF1674 domain-containing protein [Alphaproteobacteria bacterium]
MSMAMSNPTPPTKPGAPAPSSAATENPSADGARKPTGETGGPKGPEPTRFGDWERNGRCVDF